MEEQEKGFMSWLNDETVRNNAESVITALAAIAFVIISKGFINGFTFDLFLTLEPYASGIGVGVATSLIQNNMISRAVPDEILDNVELSNIINDISKLDKQITDYDYTEYFIEEYNKKEFERLQKLATDSEVRSLKYRISIKKSLGRKYGKLQSKLDYVNEYGAKVKGYKRVSLQDLLSFQASGELKGKDKINFDPIGSQRKSMMKSRLVLFLASGLMAGLPLATGSNGKELTVFLALWIPMLCVTAFRTYLTTRKITKTIYFKSLQYKKNVLKLCIDSYEHYIPPVKEEPIEYVQIEKAP